MAIRSTSVHDEDVVVIPLVEQQIVIVGNPDYFKKFDVPIHPNDLTNHNCITYGLDEHRSRWKFMINGQMQRVPVKGSFGVNGNSLIKKAALNGRGIAKLPSYFVANELLSGQLLKVLEPYYPPTYHLNLSYAYQGQLPLKNRCLIDFIKGWFRRSAHLRQDDEAGSISM